MSRTGLAGLLALGLWASAVPASAFAQSPPEQVADEFQRGFQSMAWAGLAQRVHPGALAYIRLAVRIVLDTDSTGWALEHLLGGIPDRAAYERLDDEEVFRRIMAGVQAQSPGLLSSLVSRRSHVLGTVMEGGDTAHVVYRIVSLVQGAEPEVKVMTLLRTNAGWKVHDADEIRVLHTAVRGFPIPRGSPQGSRSRRVSGPRVRAPAPRRRARMPTGESAPAPTRPRPGATPPRC